MGPCCVWKGLWAMICHNFFSVPGSPYLWWESSTNHSWCLTIDKKFALFCTKCFSDINFNSFPLWQQNILGQVWNIGSVLCLLMTWWCKGKCRKAKMTRRSLITCIHLTCTRKLKRWTSSDGLELQLNPAKWWIFSLSLSDGTKPVSEPVYCQCSVSSNHQICSVTFTWKQFHKKCSWTICNILKNDCHLSLGKWVNSLGLSDAIWQQKTGSTLAQVMASCLTAPSHYLNQCWLMISKV